MLLDIFIEGLGSALLPCSLVLLVPGVATTFIGRKDRVLAVIAFVLGSVLYSWLEASNNGGGLNDTSAGIIFAVASLIAITETKNKNVQVATIIASLLSGVAASAIWIPCTGEQLGNLQETLPAKGLTGIFDQAAYSFGVLIPLAVIISLMNIVKPATMKRFYRSSSYIGGGILMIFAVLVVSGNHTDIISRLVSWSV